MEYDKVKYGEYLVNKVQDKFPKIVGLRYEIIPENPGVSIAYEYGSVETSRFNHFMTYMRFNDETVQEALRLDKEEQVRKIEAEGYLYLLLLAVFSIIILAILIVF